jgi:hypothetical protein
MQTVFVVRLLDANRQVLAWNHIPAHTKGDGGLWADHNFVAEAQETGEAVAMCFHWPEVHVYQTRPLLQPVHVDAGKVVSIPILATPMLHIQSEPLELPPVTVRTNVTIGIGAAQR